MIKKDIKDLIKDYFLVSGLRSVYDEFLKETGTPNGLFIIFTPNINNFYRDRCRII